MVDLTIGVLCCFTTYNRPDALFVWRAGEIVGVGLIAVVVAFVVPAIFNLRRQMLEEREEAEDLAFSQSVSAPLHPADSRS